MAVGAKVGFCADVGYTVLLGEKVFNIPYYGDVKYQSYIKPEEVEEIKYIEGCLAEL